MAPQATHEAHYQEWVPTRCWVKSLLCKAFTVPPGLGSGRQEAGIGPRRFGTRSRLRLYRDAHPQTVGGGPFPAYPSGKTWVGSLEGSRGYAGP